MKAILKAGMRNLLTWALGAAGVLLMVLFALYGRFSPSAGIWYGAGFLLLLALSLAIARAAPGGGEGEARAVLEHIMRGEYLDLRLANLDAGASDFPLTRVLVRFACVVRDFLLSMSKGLQQCTFNFFSLERRIGYFFKAFVMMSELITKGVASGEKVSGAAATQLASSEDIADTAQNLARVASDVNNSIRQAGEGAQKGNARLAEMGRVFKSAEENARRLEGNADELSVKMDAIAGTVRVVTGIAEQTNLLALNASIEAARAGEAGRGFAVVANEVKKLADECKSAASRISSSLEELVGGVHEVTASIKSMSSFMKDADTTVREVLGEIGGVLSTISKVSEASEVVAASAQELGASSEELTGSAQIVEKEADRMRRLLTDVGSEVESLHASAEALLSTAKDGAREASDMIGDMRAVKLMTPEEFALGIENAIEAHRNWINGLKSSLRLGRMEQETDPTRCRFGVFLSTVECPDAISRGVWKDMLALHEHLHAQGHRIEDALRADDRKNADRLCREAEKISKDLIAILRQMSASCKTRAALVAK